MKTKVKAIHIKRVLSTKTLCGISLKGAHIGNLNRVTCLRCKESVRKLREEHEQELVGKKYFCEEDARSRMDRISEQLTMSKAKKHVRIIKGEKFYDGVCKECGAVAPVLPEEDADLDEKLVDGTCEECLKEGRKEDELYQKYKDDRA
jgi:hypothetical protein